jgi:GNAT superfamily N-acetyltransferase
VTYRLAFTEDPATFLAAATEFLAAEPVVSTVLSTFTERLARERAEGSPAPDHPCWWVSVHDGDDRVISVAMRTAPFEPHPMFVLPMPDDAARAIADAVAARDEDVVGVNGALPAAEVLARTLAGHYGGSADIHEHTRLHVLGELVEPPSPPGRLRAATPDDAELSLAWFQGFLAEAAEQAGRPHAPLSDFHDDEFIAGKIAREEIWLWETEDGEVVHLTAHNPPSFGVARIGPVFTPKAHRGRGYASAGVAGVSRRLRDGGAEVCLYTDQANPTSNKVYAAIGYEPLVDQGNWVVTRPARA